MSSPEPDLPNGENLANELDQAIIHTGSLFEAFEQEDLRKDLKTRLLEQKERTFLESVAYKLSKTHDGYTNGGKQRKLDSKMIARDLSFFKLMQTTTAPDVLTREVVDLISQPSLLNRASIMLNEAKAARVSFGNTYDPPEDSRLRRNERLFTHICYVLQMPVKPPKI